jgi:hypothetical protein
MSDQDVVMIAGHDGLVLYGPYDFEAATLAHERVERNEPVLIVQLRDGDSTSPRSGVLTDRRGGRPRTQSDRRDPPRPVRTFRKPLPCASIRAAAIPASRCLDPSRSA